MAYTHTYREEGRKEGRYTDRQTDRQTDGIKKTQHFFVFMGALNV
jgi:hypothetical protein